MAILWDFYKIKNEIWWYDLLQIAHGCVLRFFFLFFLFLGGWGDEKVECIGRMKARVWHGCHWKMMKEGTGP